MKKGVPPKVVQSWVTALVCILCLFLPSFLRLPTPSGPVTDKLFHLVVYAVAGFVVMRGVCHLPMGESPLVAFMFAFLLIGAVGVVDEIHQLFVPGRQMDRLDLVFDLVGAASGISLFLVWQRRNGR